MTEAERVAGGADIVALLALADEDPEVDELRRYLDHVDADVRRAAVDVVSEVLPDCAFEVLVDAMADADASVRRVAADALRELQDMLPDDPTVTAKLTDRLGSPDPWIRQVSIRLLRRARSADTAAFVAAAHDDEPQVRIEAIRALVRVGNGAAIRELADDPDREVRVWVARALGLVADPSGGTTLLRLASDAEPWVRAAALEAMPPVGLDESLLALVLSSVADPRWEVRKGAASALAAAPDDTALPPLVELSRDDNIDVRKVAVQSMAHRRETLAVRAALEDATTDTDADVRAYARAALA